MSRSRAISLLLIVFVLSGFAGLIYQSIWSHYLGLVLGHAAHAQTLVLSMFMGGMALGAWLISRYADSRRRLIFGYGVVELLIGLAGLTFHPVFVGYMTLSQESVIPALGGSGFVPAWQWLSAGLLIAPQTVLLGATFPLMVQGVLRLDPGRDGEALGGMYFTNGLGASLGVLAATFLLLPAMGMPGAMLVAGGLNIVVGLAACFISFQVAEARIEPVVSFNAVAGGDEVAPPIQGVPLEGMTRVVLVATFASSAASFVYEIGWVRLLNQALGSTLHSFELMLAAFIAGMAFGGLWVRKRSASIAEPMRYVGYVQVLMGLSALLSVPLLTQSFEWVGWLMKGLGRTSEGYVLYGIGTAVIAILIMVPAAFFAGMTLPVFTTALLRRGAGESAIGRVYALNTLGAIVGVVLAVHLLIPHFGVGLSITLAAFIDAVIGLLILRFISPPRHAIILPSAFAASVIMVVIAILLGRPDPAAQASGVYRTGQDRIDGEVVYLKDGKTATIAGVVTGDVVTISTNGKPDASLRAFERPPTADEITMVMAGALALSAPERPERIGIIGWGSGLSTHTVLGSPVPKVVESIEIERAMWEGAKIFVPRVSRAYLDPRSQVHFDDARTFFASGQGQYDAILAEPSNPWVSGVASLFTQEFYSFSKRHLREGGALVQWLQTYELSDPVFAEMIAALLEVFPEVDVYTANAGDLLLVARNGPARALSNIPFETQDLAAELRRVGLGSLADIEARRLGDARALRNIVRLFNAVPHSDYHPTVSLRAPRDRFMNQRSMLLTDLVRAGYPILNILSCRKNPADDIDLLPESFESIASTVITARHVRAALETGEVEQNLYVEKPIIAMALRSVIATAKFGAPSDQDFESSLAILGSATLSGLPRNSLRSLWAERRWLSPDAPVSPLGKSLLDLYAHYGEEDWSAAVREARGLLESEATITNPSLREHVMLLGMLADMAEGNVGAVRRWEDSFGKSNMSNTRFSLRSFLLAWDGEQPVCAATSAVSPTNR